MMIEDTTPAEQCGLGGLPHEQLFQDIEFTKSSGNVFADLDLEDAEELLTRAKLGIAVRRILESRNLKQQQIVELLDIKQPEVSNIMKGKYYLFSEARLFSFLNKLEKKVTIQISNHTAGEALIDVAEVG
jgi:predicted XRE-type DNA-binding protein